MKRRTFIGAMFTGPVAAALARTLPKVEQAAPPLAFDSSAYTLDAGAGDWDLGTDQPNRTPERGRVSVEIGGTTYYLLAYD